MPQVREGAGGCCAAGGVRGLAGAAVLVANRLASAVWMPPVLRRPSRAASHVRLPHPVASQLPAADRAPALALPLPRSAVFRPQTHHGMGGYSHYGGMHYGHGYGYGRHKFKGAKVRCCEAGSAGWAAAGGRREGLAGRVWRCALQAGASPEALGRLSGFSARKHPHLRLAELAPLPAAAAAQWGKRPKWGKHKFGRFKGGFKGGKWK